MESHPDTKDKGNKMRDKRKTLRQDFSFAVLEYVLNSGNNHEAYIGFTLNVSKFGLCFYTPKVLNEGQKITIKGAYPIPSKTAVVKWTEKYDDVFYKVGLVFI